MKQKYQRDLLHPQKNSKNKKNGKLNTEREHNMDIFPFSFIQGSHKITVCSKQFYKFLYLYRKFINQ